MDGGGEGGFDSVGAGDDGVGKRREGWSWRQVWV
jgi:hypothetical protein